jgi:hypothetical protein
VPNELRIDAAERDKVKTEIECAAASIGVELSRTPENTNLLFHLELDLKSGLGSPAESQIHQSIK